MSMLETATNDFQKTFASNVAAATIVAPAPFTSAPGWGWMDLAKGNALLLAFYGVGSANQSGAARVTGISRVGQLWVPIPLLVLSFTLGAKAGIAGADVLDTELFADTIAVTTDDTTGLDDASYKVSSGADDQVAYLRLDTLGCRYARVDLAKGNCTSVNSLWRTY